MIYIHTTLPVDMLEPWACIRHRQSKKCVLNVHCKYEGENVRRKATIIMYITRENSYANKSYELIHFKVRREQKLLIAIS